MAIYTPSGLRVRVTPNLAFALMKRLYPKILPYKFLSTVEVIGYMPGLFFFIIVVVELFSTNENVLSSAVIASIGYILCGILNIYGLYIIPFLLKLALFMRVIYGYFIIHFLMAILIYVKTGLQGLLIYSVSYIVSSLFVTIIYILIGKSRMKKTGEYLGTSERDFFLAYNYYASKLKINLDLDISESELDENNWSEVLEVLSKEYPKIVNRLD